jgi:superfamily II DNA or RNA helicase
MSKIARVLSNPVVAKVEGIDDPTKLALSEAMSYIVEGYEHTAAGQSGWDGRTTLYDWTSGKFPAGFIPTALAILQQSGYTAQQVKHPLPTPLGPLPTNGNPLVDSFPFDADREYQFKCVRILEKHGSFIARVATGGGKSRIAALCIKRIARKTVFITTRQVLLYQMGEALEEAGFKTSYIGDGVWDTSGDVVLAMVPTLAQRIAPFAPADGVTPAENAAAATKHQKRQQEAIDFLDTVEFVIAEEAHEAGGQGYFDVCKALRRAHYRLALTATPMMRDGESNVRLVAMFGPIRIEVSEEQLIEAGILATPKFKFIPIDKTKQPPTLRRTTAWQKAEELGIVQNHIRNKHVCAEVIRASRWGLPAMVLVKRKNHGKILHEMLKQYGLKGTYIFGESDKDKRKDALQKLKDGRYHYVIGSTILDVGVDVPGIGVLVLAGGGKAEVAHRQRIGRGLRRKTNVPNFAFIVDFDDGNNKHLIKHAKQRRAIVEQTPGFKQGILSPRTDFDLVGLGFRPPSNDNSSVRTAA